MTETTTTAAETAADDTGTNSIITGSTDVASVVGGTASTGAGSEEFDAARAKALIDKLREKEKEGDKAAKALKDAQARLDAIEAEKLTEAERITKERDDLAAQGARKDAELQDLRLSLAVHSEAQTLGILDADLALAALDRSKLEFDADGTATNLTDVLGELLERKPILKGTPAKPTIPATDGGAGGGGKAPELTADELEAAQQLGQTPEKFAALKRLRGPDGTIKVSDAIAALTKQ